VGKVDGVTGGVRTEIVAAWRAGCAAWPAIDLSLEELAPYLAARAEGDVLPSIERAADLYLVCASVLRKRAALGVLDAQITAVASRAAARFDPSPSFAAVVAQDLLARLLLGDPPKIAEYAGRAPLASWLRTAATRTALNARRSRADAPHDTIPSALAASDAPEVALLRARYRDDFERVLREVVAALPERERTVLRMNLRDRQSIDAIAAHFGVGRSTAARWLAGARETLAREAQQRLQAALAVSPSELASLTGAVRSVIDVNLVDLLDK
jgi:RNA polymerase sigma-70 factor (ECF subfamily)